LADSYLSWSFFAALLPMLTLPAVSSIESIFDQIGARAAGHMNLTFRRVFTDAFRSDHVIRAITGEAHPFGNVAIISSLDDLDLIREASAPLVSDTFPSAVIFPAGVSDAARQALNSMGFADEGGMPAMAANIAQIPPTSLPKGYELMRINRGENDQAWAETFAVGYGLPLGLARLFSPLEIVTESTHSADVQFFAVKHEDRIVATSMLYLADGLAGLYCVAVLADQRGKGLGAYVTAQALQVAAGLGYHVAVLHSPADGHAVYKRLVF